MQFASQITPSLRGLGMNQATLSMKLPTLGKETLTLVGHSRAADSTAFFIPELSLSLDAGPGAPVHTQRPAHVLITHGHSDHSFGMTGLVSRTKPPDVYVPRASAPALADYLFASQVLSNASETPMRREEYVLNHSIIAVEPGNTIQMGREIEADVFACDHSCMCVGYAVYRVRDALRDDFKGSSEAELKALRQAGVTITQRVRTPLFVFCGDTTTTIFNDASWLDEMPVVITECTFLEERHRVNAERTKHTLWTDLEPVIRLHPSTTFVLIHFSHQYKCDDVVRFFKQMDDAPWNIVVWLESE